jgi:hypothetical protein
MLLRLLEACESSAQIDIVGFVGSPNDKTQLSRGKDRALLRRLEVPS